MHRFASWLAAFISCYMPLAAQKNPLPALDPSTKKAVIDSLSQALNNFYVYPEQAAAMTKHLQQQWQKHKYDAPLNGPALAEQLMTDIRTVHKDRHLQIRFDPNLQQRIVSFNATKQPDRTDVAREQRENFYFRKAEVLPGNIGYITFTNFSDTSEQARATVRAAMQFVAYTDALIIDLRNNYGGNGIMAGEIAGYFFKEKVYAGRRYSRIGNTWTDMWQENNPALTKGLVLNMPVYILTSQRTFSAAEGMAYSLQQLKRAVVIGDTTRGGAHLTRSFSLGNGFVGFIPFSRSESVISKTDWEGTGVIPDTRDIESNSLVTAQTIILETKLSTTADSTERRKLQWLINYCRAQNVTMQATPTEISKFTGQFEEFLFTTTNHQLTCTNTSQRNRTNKLTPVTNNLFVLDDECQVEFLLDAQDRCNTIKLYWRDGWVDVVTRTK
jgi:hypothetical protein